MNSLEAKIVNDPNSSQPEDLICPYPGLRPFDREDRPYFFGRRNQENDLRKKIERRSFVAAVGPSGCGKSSLIRSGLIPRLVAPPTGEKPWQVIEMRLGTDPFGALAEAAYRSIENHTAQLSDYQGLIGRLRRPETTLHEALKDFGLLRSPDISCLVIVDQFEEIFRYAREVSRSNAEAFVALLIKGALPKDTPSPENSDPSASSAHVLVTMRTDFIAQCPQFPNLPEVLNNGLFLTPRLGYRQLKEIIELPALHSEGEIDPSLTTLLLNDIETVVIRQSEYETPEADQLPLLQNAMRRMWKAAVHRMHEISHEISDDDPLLLNCELYDHIAHYSPETNLSSPPLLPGGRLVASLNAHAEELYRESTQRNPVREVLIEWLFRCLTERFAGRETRRPQTLRQIALVALGGLANSDPDPDPNSNPNPIPASEKARFKKLLEQAEAIAARDRLPETNRHHKEESSAESSEHIEQAPTLDSILEPIIKELSAIIDIFRADDHSFLTPLDSSVKTLEPSTVIDLMHEVLLRRWNRLRGWLEQEYRDRTRFDRIEDAASNKRAPLAGVDLRDASKWLTNGNATLAWALQYRTFAIDIATPEKSPDETTVNLKSLSPESRPRSRADFELVYNFIKESETEQLRLEQKRAADQQEIEDAKIRSAVADVKAEEAKAIADSERKRADAEKAKADAEAQRADAETQRANAEEAKANAEKQRADAEEAKANAEKQRADAEEFRAGAEILLAQEKVRYSQARGRFYLAVLGSALLIVAGCFGIQTYKNNNQKIELLATEKRAGLLASFRDKSSVEILLNQGKYRDTLDLIDDWIKASKKNVDNSDRIDPALQEVVTTSVNTIDQTYPGGISTALMFDREAIVKDVTVFNDKILIAQGNQITLYDDHLKKSSEENNSYTFPDPVSRVTTDTSGKNLLVVTTPDETVAAERVYIVNGKPEKKETLQLPQGRVEAICLSGDTLTAVCKSSENFSSIQKYRKQVSKSVPGKVTWEKLPPIVLKETKSAGATPLEFSSVKLSPDGKFVAGAKSESSLPWKLYDTSTGNEIKGQTGYEDIVFASSNVSKDSTAALLITADKKKWNVQDVRLKTQKGIVSNKPFRLTAPKNIGKLRSVDLVPTASKDVDNLRHLRSVDFATNGSVAIVEKQNLSSIYVYGKDHQLQNILALIDTPLASAVFNSRGTRIIGWSRKSKDNKLPVLSMPTDRNLYQEEINRLSQIVKDNKEKK